MLCNKVPNNNIGRFDPAARNAAYKSASFAFLLLAISVVLAISAQPVLAISSSSQNEVLQARATLKYHEKDYAGTLELLKQLLAKDPGNISALELQALSERGLQDDQGALRTYRQLLKLADDDKKAPYDFEFAMLLFRHQRPRASRIYFENAANGNFNAGTSRFFMGLIDFKNKEWEAARENFAAALTYPDAKTLTAVSRYYLASAFAQLGKSDDAIRNYYLAKQTVDSNEATAWHLRPDAGVDSLSGDIRNNALKELKNLDRGNHFATLSLISQWDSNVQANPSDAPNPVPQSQQRSLKAVVSAMAGLSTSPTRNFQIVPSLRFFTNYNLNLFARSFDFISATPSLLMMYRPYARFSMGMKGEMTYTMQDQIQVGSATATTSYAGYSFTGDVGPLARYELTPTINMTAEISWRPKKFYLDASSGDTRRTGQGGLARISAEHTGGNLFNPLAYLTYEFDSPVGTTYQFNAIGGGVANSMQLHPKLSITETLDLTSTDYYATVNPERKDFMISVRLSAHYSLSPHWSALVDAGYLRNGSTVPATFQYNRIVASAGATYSF